MPGIENVAVTLDSKGRVRASMEQRQIIIAEYERCGVSAAQFAKRSGLKYSTFAGWLARYRRNKRQGGGAAVRLLEAVRGNPFHPKGSIAECCGIWQTFEPAQHAAVAREFAGGRRSDRARAGETKARGMALHRTGSQRATGL
jgi:hypothetical protein